MNSDCCVIPILTFHDTYPVAAKRKECDEETHVIYELLRSLVGLLCTFQVPANVFVCTQTQWDLLLSKLSIGWNNNTFSSHHFNNNDEFNGGINGTLRDKCIDLYAEDMNTLHSLPASPGMTALIDRGVTNLDTGIYVLQDLDHTWVKISLPEKGERFHILRGTSAAGKQDTMNRPSFLSEIQKIHKNDLLDVPMGIAYEFLNDFYKDPQQRLLDEVVLVLAHSSNDGFIIYVFKIIGLLFEVRWLFEMQPDYRNFDNALQTIDCNEQTPLSSVSRFENRLWNMRMKRDEPELVSLMTRVNKRLEEETTTATCPRFYRAFVTGNARNIYHEKNTKFTTTCETILRYQANIMRQRVERYFVCTEFIPIANDDDFFMSPQDEYKFTHSAVSALYAQLHGHRLLTTKYDVCQTWILLCKEKYAQLGKYLLIPASSMASHDMLEYDGEDNFELENIVRGKLVDFAWGIYTIASKMDHPLIALSSDFLLPFHDLVSFPLEDIVHHYIS